MKFTEELLEQAAEFEKRWDLRMGGDGTRPYRELFGFTAGRIMLHGASLEDLVAYLRELRDFVPQGKADA
jgi:hypothetical protein